MFNCILEGIEEILEVFIEAASSAKKLMQHYTLIDVLGGSVIFIILILICILI